MSNIRVTYDSDPNNARSESNIAINPNKPSQVVAGSKEFRNFQTYDFTLATEYSINGGQTWQPSASLTLPTDPTDGTAYTLLTDPTMAWDDQGSVYLVGLAGHHKDGPPPGWDESRPSSIAIYKSTDGGKTWSQPKIIHTDKTDDKQWVAGDSNPASPFHGRMYAIWDGPGGLCFARTIDHGANWIGTGANPAGFNLAQSGVYPDITVAPNGDIYLVAITNNEITMSVSSDGGDSFQTRVSPATGVTALDNLSTKLDGWPVFGPNGTFRVQTFPTISSRGGRVVVAWADLREGVSRIYYSRSIDGGASWLTGSSGQALLPGMIPGNVQHFHAQLTSDPNGVVGCAFYEFGPKSPDNRFRIDVILAQSFDNGASFDHFTVTDQAWDPTLDAPLAEGGPHVTFIGDYFGLDASVSGFCPLWTDTRTGIQELFMAIAPEKGCVFIVNRSMLGQDEIDKLGGPAPRALPVIIHDAFRVVVDGFSAIDLGLSGPNSTLVTLPTATPATGITIVPKGNAANNGNYGPGIQRFTFYYDMKFDKNDSAFGFTSQTQVVNLAATVGNVTAAGQIELIKQPDPYILHGDTSWLSIDLRVFVVRQGKNVPNVSLLTVNPLQGAADAPRFIKDVMANITPTQFDSLPSDEDHCKLYLYPNDESTTPVFNFALAKVHYTGQIGASDVRVFFRLFQAQSTTSVYDYQPNVPYGQYRRTNSTMDGKPIPLPGVIGNEYVTVPCFAEKRIDSTTNSVDSQIDPKNVNAFVAGVEVDHFYGCWLDINQPTRFDDATQSLIPNNVLPIYTPFDTTRWNGPFDPSLQPVTIQEAILRNLHQCLIAEINFTPTPIPYGKDPSNWDKLAQRNLSWSNVGSAQAVTTFEIRPTATALPAGQKPDELMIDWGNTPKGCLASIYLPAVSADTILEMAGRMYSSYHLARSDAHTVTFKTDHVSYIPIPLGSDINFTGLLTVALPESLEFGQVFNVVVRQVTNAYGSQVSSPQSAARRKGKAAEAVMTEMIAWRRVLGAFQLTIPVGKKNMLLVREERELSVLRWIGEAIPANNRWYPTFSRYLEIIAGRVSSFGGNPRLVLPSPTGDGSGDGHRHTGYTCERCVAFSGKIAGLIFDRFGDFDGFLLETEKCEHRFSSREKEIRDLAERAWRERLFITVWVECDAIHRPLSIIVRTSTASFSH